MAAQADNDHNRPLIFVRIDYGYPNDPLLGVTAPFPITLSGTGDPNLDGFTFQSLEGMSIGDLKQDTTGAIQEMQLTLANNDSSPFIDLIEEDVWWGSPAKVWFAYFMDDFTQVVFAPSLRVSGILDKLTVTLDKDVSVASAVIRSNRLLFERNRGSRMVAAQHQARHPTDRCFSFLPRLSSGELLLTNAVPPQPARDQNYDNYAPRR